MISDTSHPGYMDVPRDVMQGYQLMVEEAARAARGAHPCLRAGRRGRLRRRVCGYFWERAGGARPVFVVVEPERADCLYQSARRRPWWPSAASSTR